MNTANHTILTRHGWYFDLAHPAYNVICIDEIAAALSKLCRFTGHTRYFYSVAQHSVLVSHNVPPEHALAGLLHDAAEAYVGDVSAPLKAMLPDYQALERRVQAAVLRRFNLAAELPREVKTADLLLLNTERRDLMNSGTGLWHGRLGVGVLDEHIAPLMPADAEELFMARYNQIMGAAQ